MKPTSTRFTSLVGCDVPIQLAPMGGVATSPDLAAAVAEAGGHGLVAAIILPPPALEQVLDELSRRTSGAWGVGFIVAVGAERERVELAASKAALVDFFWGDPDPDLVALVHEGGALCEWQVGSVKEARSAEEAGCDVIVAQGVEAGGHVRGEVGLLPLLDGVLNAVEVPVLAAGGIATPQDVAAAFSAGADGVRVGTRFIAAREADVHPEYLEALLAAKPEDTVLTEAFHVMWPDAPHRVLRSSLEAAQAFEGEVVGETEVGGQTVPIPRFSVPGPTRRTKGAVEAMPHYAGLGVGAVREVKPAAEILRELSEGAG